MNTLRYRNCHVSVARLQLAPIPLWRPSLSNFSLWKSVQWWDLGSLSIADIRKCLRGCPYWVNTIASRSRLWLRLSNVSEFREITPVLLLLDKVFVQVLRVLNARFDLFKGLKHNHVLLVDSLDFLLSNAMIKRNLRWKQLLCCLLSRPYIYFMLLVEG